MLELRAGEGGDDAKQFVCELAAAYVRYGQLHQIQAEILAVDEAHQVIKFAGQGVWRAFEHEAGKHCVQRCPRNNRRQTSIVVVGVLPLPNEIADEPLDPQEIDVQTQGGRGPGGQHQNKTDSAVRMVHRPTGIRVFINGRDQQRNRRDALRVLSAKVHQQRRAVATAKHSAKRKAQLGDGGRSNKVRTYNFIDSRVVDHRLRRQTKQIKQVMKGRFDLLLK